MLSVRRLVRLGIVAALVASALGIASTMAHAATSPGPSVNVAIQCDPISGSQYKSANWHVHMALDAGAPSGMLFTAWADMGAGGPQYLFPGQSADMVIDARDGLGSQLTVSADGNVVYQQIKTIVCNAPITSAVFSCGNDKFDRTITYTMNNPSPSTYNFLLHNAGGVELNIQLTANSKSLIEHVSDGTHYHAWISQIGNKLTDIEGDVNCESAPPTTTPPTTTPPTTAPPTTTPPTTVPPVTDPPTTVPPATAPPTTVVSHGKQPGPTTTVAAAAPTSDPDPTASSTAAPAAAPTGQLPFTGGSSVPLGALGFVFVALGGLALLVLRRSAARS